MQHGIVVHFIDTRDGADVTGQSHLDLAVLTAVELQQLIDLDWFSSVPHKQLIAAKLKVSRDT